MVDLYSAGTLRALMNFILPIGQLLTVLSVFSLPKLARRMKEIGPARGLRLSAFYSFGIISIALIYGLSLVLLGTPLERLLYGGRMAAYVDDLPWLALAALLSGVAIAFSSPLRAAQNSQHALFAGVAATLVGVGSFFSAVATLWTARRSRQLSAGEWRQCAGGCCYVYLAVRQTPG